MLRLQVLLLHSGKINAFVCVFLVLLYKCALCEALSDKEFPSDFLFGAATSAYQTEGAHNEDGKGPSVWDHDLQNHQDLVIDSSNGNIACDSYHKYKEDVKLLKEMGVNYYRFSISWPRILPDGYANNVNQKGLLFYNNLIDELISNGIQPMVTMYHWDLPQKLQELGGWTNPNLVDYFEDYAKVLFDNFGDRVKYWLTFNSFCDTLEFDGFVPIVHQSGIGVYLCYKNEIVAHARVYRLYDREYRSKQNGMVGIVASGGSGWYKEASNSANDISAAERIRLFTHGMILNPLLHPDGDFPEAVKDRVLQKSLQEGFQRSRLPTLTPSEIKNIKGAYDFIGLNIYTTALVEDVPENNSHVPSLDNDLMVKRLFDNRWKSSASAWLKVTPWAIKEFLVWMKDRYNNPPIFITENGFSDDGKLDDQDRVDFFKEYLSHLLEAIYEDGVNVKGYTAWSLLDNFEWTSGYSEKFGLHRVDHNDPERKRTPKASAKWYKNVIKNRRLSNFDEEPHNEL